MPGRTGRPGDFNPRPLAGATQRCETFRFSETFQSTPPCGGDFVDDVLFGFGHDFNPRPLAGATKRNGIGTMWSDDFNPRPLAGATWRQCGGVLPIIISIHAPLRGRRHLGQCPNYSWIFQSTPPCGGDRFGKWRGQDDPDFNPRPLAGATNFFDGLRHLDEISIHAPLRGRLPSQIGVGCCSDFNPRPLAGATPPRS